MKLSKRLKQIEQMVTSNYTHIWDCCCDHGLLGAALLSKSVASTVHFVDIVPDLMNELEIKLNRFYPTVSWKTHCIDVAELPLQNCEGTHLIILDGIGGDLMIQFIDAICKKYPDASIEFLLCPVHHQFSLRQKLIEYNFSLKNELLVEENKRFYEIIHVTTIKNESNNNNNISPVGNSIWHTTSEDEARIAKKYLNKTLQHYQRIQQGNSHNVQHVIDAYQKIIL